MKKKEIKISNEELMELMGLKRTSNSDDDSDKTAIDLAIEKNNQSGVFLYMQNKFEAT